MITIEFTEEQLKVQLQLNDLAVKAGGMQVAEAAVVLCHMYQDALRRPQQPMNGSTPGMVDAKVDRD